MKWGIKMLVEQVYIFGWSILVGVILGFLFDLFRGLRWEGIRDIWVYIQDALFWLVSALIIIVSTFLINKGELRGYMLIGYVLGSGFYILLFSKYVLAILKFINKKIRDLFKALIKAINIDKLKIKNSPKEKEKNKKKNFKINFKKQKNKKLGQEI